MMKPYVVLAEPDPNGDDKTALIFNTDHDTLAEAIAWVRGEKNGTYHIANLLRQDIKINRKMVEQVEVSGLEPTTKRPRKSKPVPVPEPKKEKAAGAGK